MLCLDWESNQNSQWGNEAYLEQMVKRIIERTGIPPMIYVQQSRMSAVKPIAQRNKLRIVDCTVCKYETDRLSGYTVE